MEANRKILFLVNHDIVIYNFRKELVRKLIEQNYDVYISSPYGKKIDYFIELGCKFIDTKISRHGVNLIEDFRLYSFYKKIIRDINPFVVLTYTIKPNIYGGFAAKKKQNTLYCEHYRTWSCSRKKRNSSISNYFTV